jgi:hypothetical protein
MLEVSDCAGTLLERRRVVTDANGSYTTCLSCAASESCPTWRIARIPECCAVPAPFTSFVEGCPPHLALPDDTCTSTTACTPSGCPSGETEVRGQVTCIDPTTGGAVPVPDCDVVIQSPGCIDTDGDTVCDAPCPTLALRTDADGNYSGCMPCPECQFYTATALCCGASSSRDILCGMPSVLDISCGECGPPPDPCTPNDFSVAGRVTCLGPSGLPEPVAGCTVIVECPTDPASQVTTVTDSNGDYQLCYPCTTCTAIRVTAECCGVSQDVSNPRCDDLRVDLDCGACIPVRPCPPPPAVEAHGVLLCDTGTGSTPTPLAGCPVVLTAIAADGSSLSPVTTVTQGDGSYVACVPCSPDGLSAIQAQATCCTASSTTPVTGCPETATLEPLRCTDCSPCPPGMTRLQGRVRCRGGGPVADCDVLVVVETCAGPRTFQSRTDSEGKYRLCVPCPCDGGDIRVVATCCGATRVVESDSCGPVTPVPTLFCPVPCR